MSVYLKTVTRQKNISNDNGTKVYTINKIQQTQPRKNRKAVSRTYNVNQGSMKKNGGKLAD